MATHKTQKNDASVDDFINSIEDETKRNDSRVICELMEAAVGEPPTMWGTAIIGFGEVENTNTMGTATWPLLGFSPRKQSLTLYLEPSMPNYEDYLAKLGKHTTSKACLYIKRLSNVDIDVLNELIQASATFLQKRSTSNS